MAISGKLTDAPVPDILSMLGRGCGVLKVEADNPQRIMEVHCRHGFVAGFYLNGQPVVDVIQVRDSFTSLITLREGHFSFSKSTEADMPKLLNLPLDHLLLVSLAGADEIEAYRSYFPDHDTAFQVARKDILWMDDNLREFWGHCEESFGAGVTAADLARKVGISLDQVLLYLFKLRTAGIIRPAQALLPVDLLEDDASAADAPEHQLKTMLNSWLERLLGCTTQVISDETPPPVKIAVVGPVGSGKTTLITSVSETEVMTTEQVASEEIGKETTTVAMDFGSLMVDDYPILLFGTPGQDRFDFMRDILCDGASGVVLTVAADKPGTLPEARKMTDALAGALSVPVLLVVTRLDLADSLDIESVTQYFGLPASQVMSADARERRQCFAVMHRLFGLINSAAGYQAAERVA